MKVPLHPLANASRSIIKPVNVESPEAVGPATATDDSTTGHMLNSAHEHPAQPPPLADAPEAKADDPYAGGDRRHQNRRGSLQQTTLDTRKEGMDRRLQSRINLKV